MSIEQQVRDLNYKRMRSVEAGRAILDRASLEGRDLNPEEQRGYDRAMDEITRFDKQRERLLSSDAAAEEADLVNDELRRIATPVERRADINAERMMLEFFKRDGAGHITLDLGRARAAHDYYRQGARGSELRAVVGDSGASGGSLTLPTTVESTVWQYFVSSNAMRRLPCTVITSPSGAPHVVPRVSTHGIATQVATQTTAFAGTDPVLGDILLKAWDFGQLTAVSNDLMEDSGVDVMQFIAKEIGGSVGRLTSAAYITGSGSSYPTGVMTAVVGAGTIPTGGTLLTPSMENLIDLVYSVPNQYRKSGNAAWLMHDLTAATVRKLRSDAGGTTGPFIWQPSPTVGLIGGQPDTLLGYPVEIDASVASAASNAKTVAFGDWSAYWIRDVQGFRLERSNDLYFNLNQTAFRGLLRTDGNLVDTQGPAINILKQSV